MGVVAVIGGGVRGLVMFLPKPGVHVVVYEEEQLASLELDDEIPVKRGIWFCGVGGHLLCSPLV
ncbi:putative methyltransferase [Corchorus capsularis]|uniref:Putative methyltransferase n=1 Tax=Corchorus capsularis TaxID=210143 RepID=A0A1R3HIE5_COCAP|nr:putative methyltransferase [Corchorus capsularis]